MRKRKICLISPGHIASNPRLLKEADALHEAGFNIKVFCADYLNEIRLLDNTIFKDVEWNYETINRGNICSKQINIFKQKLSKQIVRLGYINIKNSIWAHSSFSNRLLNKVKNYEADLYIGHYLASLPVAAYTANKYGSKYGFDAEDYHSGELIDTQENIYELKNRKIIESRFLPECSHLTGSSPLICDKYNEDYILKMEPILNVFPTNYMDNSINHESEEESICFYWFSQTIGPGRGLENILKIISRMNNKVSVYLRGSSKIYPYFINKLNKIAEENDMIEQLIIMDQAPPKEMVNLASAYDIGLSIELNDPLSRSLCLTNKIFTYLLSGIPVILSKTKAHELIAKDLGKAALIIDLENISESAQKLDNYIQDKNNLINSKKEARELASTHFNWDKEKVKFINLVEKVFN